MDASDLMDEVARMDRINRLASAIFWLGEGRDKSSCLTLAEKLIDGGHA